MTDKALIAILLAGAFAIAFCFYAGIHGKYRDAVVGKLHDDCFMCSFYRFTHSNDAAFAIREAKRN